jgi:hypothetical protein
MTSTETVCVVFIRYPVVCIFAGSLQSNLIMVCRVHADVIMAHVRNTELFSL